VAGCGILKVYFKCYQTLLFEKYAIRISSVYARKTSSRIIAKLL
jgi:hypothetical protein